MHLSTLFAIIAPAFVTVQAGCYSDRPPKWDSVPDGINVANQLVDSICNSAGVSGSFSSTGETKYHCLNTGWDRIKFEFWVEWKGQGGTELDDGECKQRLKNEINGCQGGGQTTTAEWHFR